MTDIYHITHVTNLAEILLRGGLLCDRLCNDGNVQTQQIGYAHIKQRRMARAVTKGPGETIEFSRVAKQTAPEMQHSPLTTNMRGEPIACVSAPAFRA